MSIDNDEIPTMPLCFDADILDEFLAESENDVLSLNRIVAAITIADMDVTPESIQELSTILSARGIEVDEDEVEERVVVSRPKRVERLTSDEEIRIGQELSQSSLDILRGCLNMPFSAAYIFEAAQESMNGPRAMATVFDVQRFRDGYGDDEELDNLEEEEREAELVDTIAEPEPTGDFSPTILAAREVASQVIQRQSEFANYPVSEASVEEVSHMLHDTLRFRLASQDNFVKLVNGKNDVLKAIKLRIYRMADSHKQDRTTFSQKVMDGDMSSVRPEYVAAAQDSLRLISEFEADIGISHVEFSSHFKTIFRADKSNQRARNEMTRKNMRLVSALAQNFAARGMTQQDLVQEGNIGLMRAVEKFDPSRGNKFATYATWWIRQAITRAMSDQASIIRIPVHMRERISRVRKAERTLTEANGIKPGLKELSEYLDMPADMVRRILTVTNEPVSLDAPVSSATGQETSSMGELVPDNNAVSPMAGIIDNLRAERVASALERLHPRTEEILHYRFGLGKVPGEDCTLENVGRRFGLTRERIRQIETKAMGSLVQSSKGHGRTHGLKELIDSSDMLDDGNAWKGGVHTG